MLITQSEWMRRMKDMSAMGGEMNFYGNMPDSFNLVVNTNHPLVNKVLKDIEDSLSNEISKLSSEINSVKKEQDELEKINSSKKEEEVPQADKDKVTDFHKKIEELRDQKNQRLSEYGKKHALAKQLTDLALLSQNMLKGEDLTKFVKRSVEMIK